MACSGCDCVIDSLLIANRGEIAARVIRTARRLGIRTVAVYSDADADALHVRLADDAVRIGPPAPRESYLSVAALLDATHRTGACAIHPGYGFLSENAAFAGSCESAGIVFVGPPARAIAAMGSKAAAKESMRIAGVPVLPGYHGPHQSIADLEARALDMGFPLIVKPSGGGGGKGMHIVFGERDLRAALESAQRIAERSFGDATLVLERYLVAPRHVEVQILADAHGKVLHLHDRDCSIQRRHQKLIEEAPAPGIPTDVRTRLHEAAITVARSIGYVNAGTVEFLYEEGEFWFMEMNTRLQVEHPVTEAITGLDLVEWQLRIASGERLPFEQSAVTALGCAIEARLCAEDPAAEFAPSSGVLTRLDWPAAQPGLRIDTGFSVGDNVPPDYDSLLAKVICSGPERAGTLANLARALNDLRILGVRTNAPWLARAVRSPSLRSGPVTTRFLSDEATALAEPADDESQVRRAVMQAAILMVVFEQKGTAPGASPWLVRDSFRAGLRDDRVVSLVAATRSFDVRVRVVDADRWRAVLDDSEHEVRIRVAGGGRAQVEYEGLQQSVELQCVGRELHLWMDGAYWRFDQPPEAASKGSSNAAAGQLQAQLPGTVVKVLVSAGDAVVEGQSLMVIEAMKMEHTIRAPVPGVVARVCFAAGERVVEGARLVEIAQAD